MSIDDPAESADRIIMYAPCEGDGGHARYLRNLLAVGDAEHPWIKRITWLSSSDVPLAGGDFDHQRLLPPLKDKRSFSHLATLAASRHLHWTRRELAFVRYVVGERRSVSLVHFQDFTPWFGRLETLLFHRCGLRVVATVHNRTPHRNLGFPARLMQAWFRSFYRSCDALVFHSERMRKLADEDGITVGKPVAVAPFGAHQATVDDTAHETESRVGALVPPSFLVFGRLRLNKGVLQMIDAAERFPDLNFRFVGLPESPEMESRVQEASERLANVTCVQEFVSDEVLNEELRQSIAALLCYRDFDSESGAYVTAVGAGAAVIASDVAGLGARIADDSTGMVVPANYSIDELGQALRTFLADPALADRYRHAARAVTARMSGNWQELQDAHRTLYATLDN